MPNASGTGCHNPLRHRDRTKLAVEAEPVPRAELPLAHDAAVDEVVENDPLHRGVPAAGGDALVGTGPLWVALRTSLVATVSPSAIISTISHRMSGKAAQTTSENAALCSA